MNIYPGMYTSDVDHNLKFKEKPTHVRNKLVPFGSSDKRFFGVKSNSIDFSPTNFDQKSLSTDANKVNIHSKGVFGGTEKRFPIKGITVNKNEVGPGAYDTDLQTSMVSNLSKNSFSSLKKSAIFASPDRSSHFKGSKSQRTLPIGYYHNENNTILDGILKNKGPYIL